MDSVEKEADLPVEADVEVEVEADQPASTEPVETTEESYLSEPNDFAKADGFGSKLYQSAPAAMFGGMNGGSSAPFGNIGGMMSGSNEDPMAKMKDMMGAGGFADLMGNGDMMAKLQGFMGGGMMDKFKFDEDKSTGQPTDPPENNSNDPNTQN